jgi:hypothetical protein
MMIVKKVKSYDTTMIDDALEKSGSNRVLVQSNLFMTIVLAMTSGKEAP